VNHSGIPWRRPGDNARNRQRNKWLALLPGFAISSWFLGPVLLRNLLVAMAAGYLFASLARLLRGQPLRVVYSDMGVPTNAVLLALLIPPEVPLWLPVVAMAFASGLVSPVFGGTNQALLHPAMSGYLLVLLAFPERLGGSLPAVDPTLLSHLWINSGFLLGGLYLLQQRIIRWHIPASLLATVLIMSWLEGGLASDPLALLQVPFTGLVMLTAFFIATDFGSAAITPRGRLLYGTLLGILLASTPPGATSVAVAVVIVNFCAPLLDQLCRPRIYGHKPDTSHEELL
jgi:electron transport complex protein RnfD